MKFRKKPVEIEAVPAKELIRCFRSDWKSLPEWVSDAYERGDITAITDNDFTIKTLKGDHLARKTDMVIRGVQGEMYPCKLDIFEATYDPVA